MEILSVTAPAAVSLKAKFSPSRDRERAEAVFAGQLADYFTRLPRRLFPNNAALETWNARLIGFRQELIDILRAGMLAAAELGVADGRDWVESNIFGVVKELQVDWSLPNKRAAEWAAARAGELIMDIENTTRERVRREVVTFIESGEGVLSLAQRLASQSFEFSRRRAELIAVTEVTRAYSYGNRESWRQSAVIDGLQWVTANDEIVCPICAPLGGLGFADGEAVPVLRSEQERRAVRTEGFDAPFVHPGGRGAAGRYENVTIDLPPAHPGCRCYAAPWFRGFESTIPEVWQEVVDQPPPQPKVPRTPRPKPKPPRVDVKPAGPAPPGRAPEQTADEIRIQRASEKMRELFDADWITDPEMKEKYFRDKIIPGDVEPEVWEAFADVFTEFRSRFKLPPLNRFVGIEPAESYVAAVEAARHGADPQLGGIINTKWFRDMGEFPGGWKQVLEQAAELGTTRPRNVREIAYHEAMHYFQHSQRTTSGYFENDPYFEKLNELYSWATATGWAGKISEYAKTNPREFHAELGVALKQRADHLGWGGTSPDLLEYFRDAGMPEDMIDLIRETIPWED